MSRSRHNIVKNDVWVPMPRQLVDNLVYSAEVGAAFEALSPDTPIGERGVRLSWTDNRLLIAVLLGAFYKTHNGDLVDAPYGPLPAEATAALGGWSHPAPIIMMSRQELIDYFVLGMDPKVRMPNQEWVERRATRDASRIFNNLVSLASKTYRFAFWADTKPRTSDPTDILRGARIVSSNLIDVQIHRKTESAPVRAVSVALSPLLTIDVNARHANLAVTRTGFLGVPATMPRRIGDVLNRRRGKTSDELPRLYYTLLRLVEHRNRINIKTLAERIAPHLLTPQNDTNTQWKRFAMRVENHFTTLEAAGLLSQSGTMDLRKDASETTWEGFTVIRPARTKHTKT